MMGWHEYEASKRLSLEAHELGANAFYSLLFAVMREADSGNLKKLTLAFPVIFNEFNERYHAAGGFLLGESLSLEEDVFIVEDDCPDETLAEAWLKRVRDE